MAAFSVDELTQLGRTVVRDGRLRDLRKRLQLSRHAMCELLHTSLLPYTAWETGNVRLRASTALRVGRFYQAASTELDLLDREGVDVTGLVPFHLVATFLGIPHEVLLRRFREKEFEAADLGIFGLWVSKETLTTLRGGD